MDKPVALSPSPASYQPAPDGKGTEQALEATPHPGYLALHSGTSEASGPPPIPLGDRKVSPASESPCSASASCEPEAVAAQPEEDPAAAGRPSLAQIADYLSQGGDDFHEAIAFAYQGVRNSERPQDAAAVLLGLAENRSNRYSASIACGVGLGLKQLDFSADDIAAIRSRLRPGAGEDAVEGLDTDGPQLNAVDVGLQLACDPFAYLENGPNLWGWSRTCNLLQVRADMSQSSWKTFLIDCLQQNEGNWSPAGCAQRAHQMFEFLMHERGAGANSDFELPLFLDLSEALIGAMEAAPALWPETITLPELQETGPDTKRERKHEAPGPAGVPSPASGKETLPDAVAFVLMLERYLERTGFPAHPAGEAERKALAVRFREAASALSDGARNLSAARASLAARYEAVAQRLEA